MPGTEAVIHAQQGYHPISIDNSDAEALQLWQQGYPGHNVVLVSRESLPALIEQLQKLLTQ